MARVEPQGGPQRLFGAADVAHRESRGAQGAQHVRNVRFEARGHLHLDKRLRMPTGQAEPHTVEASPLRVLRFLEGRGRELPTRAFKLVVQIERLHSEVHVRNDGQSSVQDAVKQIIEYLDKMGYLPKE